MQTASKNHSFVIGLFFTSIGVTIGFAACTDSYDKDLSSASGHPSGGSAGGGEGGFINTDGCYDSCSNDLMSVVDCYGNIKQTCMPDEGCFNKTCIKDPCVAAEKGKSSLGCDYWALKTAQRPQADGACFAVVIANTWSRAVHLTVDRGGQSFMPQMFTYIPDVQGKNVNYKPYDPVAGIPVGEVAILFLSRGFGGLIKCPMPAAVNADTGVVGTGRGTAFNIRTDSPVVAYQIDPYGGGLTSYASATLLIPTSAWDKDYVAISAYPASTAPSYNGNPSLNILAHEDKTDVTVTPVADIIAGLNVAGTTKGTPITYTLNKGEFLQITQPVELTGSAISVKHPNPDPSPDHNKIAVFGAHTCMTVSGGPNLELDCDSAQQQIPAAHALANEYVAVRYKNRTGQEEAVPWRIVGAADGTSLHWDPAPPPGAPATLKFGEVVEFIAPGPFVVNSVNDPKNEHPFYLGGYMTGGEPYMSIGDPEWVNVIPPAQYLRHYVLFTDPTYPETSLVVVRSSVDGKFADVTLDCIGKLTGWQPIGNGKYESTVVTLVTGDFAGVFGCRNGRQEMSSTLPFGVTVWGWGTTQQTANVSYAYPAGAAFQTINDIILTPH